MPTYTFRSTITGQTFDRIMSIAERDVFVTQPGIEQIIRPVQVMSDIPEYRSPIDGSLIGSRSARRYDLEKNNCREWEPSDSPTGGKIRNHRFAKKWGLTVSEEFRDAPQPPDEPKPAGVAA
jgi:hypothetical protein